MAKRERRKRYGTLIGIISLSLPTIPRRKKEEMQKKREGEGGKEAIEGGN